MALTGPFRGMVRDARRTLHAFMRVGAFYYRWEDGVVISPIAEISVRVHDKFLRVGDLAGTNFNYADVEENSPRGIFMLAEISPKRGHYLSTQEGIYFIDSLMPPDDISVTANLTRINAARQLEGHPVYQEPTVKRVYIEGQLPSMTSEFNGG